MSKVSVAAKKVGIENEYQLRLRLKEYKVSAKMSYKLWHEGLTVRQPVRIAYAVARIVADPLGIPAYELLEDLDPDMPRVITGRK